MPALGTTPAEGAESVGDTDPPPPTRHGPAGDHETALGPGPLQGQVHAVPPAAAAARPVLRLFPPHAPSPHAQGSSGAVATVPLVWRGHTKSTAARSGPALTLPCGWNIAGRLGIIVDYPQKPTSHHDLAKAAATVAGAMR